MISMNKRIFLVLVASFFSNLAAIDGTSYSKLDHGAQVNGGVRRMIREDEETPKASGEERAGREVPDFIEFLPIRSNVEEPVAAARNVPNEVNVQNDAAMSRLSEQLGVDIGQVQEKVNLLLRARRGSGDGSEVIMFYMGLGSEYFEQLVKRDPSVTFPWPYRIEEFAVVFQPPLGPHISRMIPFVEKHGISLNDVLGKILWLQNKVVLHDPVASFYLAFGSELFRNKPASTSRARWGETLSLATPGTTHLEE